ncbi:MAG: class I SAM-dependent methyltransferase [Methanotrichaceae archaeon]
MSAVDYDKPQLAEKYDAVSDSQYNNGIELIERLGIDKGNNVLDVGCGTGRLALYTAGRVGQSGKVLGIDPAPLRIAIANKKLAGEHLTNIEFKVSSSDDLGDLDENQFNHTYLSAVFHWIPDKSSATRKIFRVLKPGGKIGITTLDKDKMPLINEITSQLLSREPYAGKADWEKDPVKPVGQKEIENILKSAGFEDIDVRILIKKKHWSTPAEAIEFVEASSFGSFLNQVPDTIRHNFRKDLEAELAKRATPDGIESTTNTIFAIAAKPTHN